MADDSPASEIAGSLVPLSRHQAMLLLEAAHIWMDMGRHDKAQEVLSGVALLMPRSEVPQLALGTLAFSQGKHDKALQAYRSAQRLAPKSALPRAYAGEALLFMGKLGEATKELNAAIQMDPEGDGARLAQALLDANNAGAFAEAKRK